MRENVKSAKKILMKQDNFMYEILKETTPRRPPFVKVKN